MNKNNYILGRNTYTCMHAYYKLVKQHFPKHHQLNKMFNKNTLKLSHFCMKNDQY